MERLKNKRIQLIYVVAFLILCTLSTANVIFSYYSTVKSVHASVANQSIELAKSVANTIDKESYKRFLANPTKNEDYWITRSLLDHVREKIGALHVYTLVFDNPKVSKAMIASVPEDAPEFPIGDPCTVPESEIRLALQGKTYVTDILIDPIYGNYLSVGAPIEDHDGKIIGYVGIDISAKTLDDIGKNVISNSISTFVFNVVIVVIVLVAVLLIQKWYQKELQKVVGETEKTYLEEFRSLISSLKSTRHDFVNHIHVLYGLIEFKYYDKALEYINSLLKEVRFVHLSLRISNPALLILFHTKWEVAQSKQIDIQFEVSEDSFDRIQSIDLIKLFSNLIDNAVDAVMELPVAERMVKVVCKKIYNYYHFEVKNSGKGISPREINHIFASGYTTKKNEDGKSRGHGLCIVQEIVKRYAGEIKVESNNQETVFRIMIPCS